MLYLIGLGLNNVKDLSLKALDVLKRCDKILFESYTSLNRLNINELEKLIDKSIQVAKREDIENHSDEIINEAKTKNIAILVIGHPLVATTHSIFLPHAKVIHNYSIFDAITVTGLELYKFGRIVSIPFHNATSFYEYIVRNYANDLHTLCLLDIKRDENYFMNINEALEKIKALDNKNLLKKPVVACIALATDDEKIFYGTYEELMQLNFSEMPKPQCLIIPSKLHPVEEEVLEHYRITKQ